MVVSLAFIPGGLIKHLRLTVQCVILLGTWSIVTFPGIMICELAFRGITRTSGLFSALLDEANESVTGTGCVFFGLLGNKGCHIFKTSPKDQQWSNTSSMSHFVVVLMNGVSILNGKVLHPYLAV